MMDPRRVAIYVRVSTVDQAREGYSLAAQEHKLRSWASERGYIVSSVYADAGISAKDMAHRPEVLRLMQDVQSGKIDIVAIWALSRLTRSVADLYHILSVIRDSGSDLYSHTESFDTSTPIGRAMIGILGVFAQMEREVTSERVRLAMAERAAQGKRTCTDVLGYDIDGDQLQVNDSEAIIVRFIFESYVAQQNISRIASFCFDHGYTGKRGQILKPESIRKILTRPVYAGFYSFDSKLYKGNFDPLIPAPYYNYVQRIMYSHGWHKPPVFVPET